MTNKEEEKYRSMMSNYDELLGIYNPKQKLCLYPMNYFQSETYGLSGYLKIVYKNSNTESISMFSPGITICSSPGCCAIAHLFKLNVSSFSNEESEFLNKFLWYGALDIARESGYRSIIISDSPQESSYERKFKNVMSYMKSAVKFVSAKSGHNIDIWTIDLDQFKEPLILKLHEQYGSKRAENNSKAKIQHDKEKAVLDDLPF